MLKFLLNVLLDMIQLLGQVKLVFRLWVFCFRTNFFLLKLNFLFVVYRRLSISNFELYSFLQKLFMSNAQILVVALFWNFIVIVEIRINRRNLIYAVLIIRLLMVIPWSLLSSWLMLVILLLFLVLFFKVSIILVNHLVGQERPPCTLNFYR